MKKLDLRREQEAARRALHSAQRAVLLNSIVIVCLAGFAIWIARISQRNADATDAKARQASIAEQRAEEELWNSRLAQARAERLSGTPGRRQRALDALTSAAQIKVDPQLRNEAVASLANYDLAGTAAWHNETTPYGGPAFSRDLDLCVVASDARNFTLERSDTREVVRRFTVNEGDYGGLGISPDGRWICAYFERGVWRFWNAETGQVKKDVRATMYRHYALQPSFSHNSQWFVMCLKSNAVHMVNLNDDSRRIIETPLMPSSAVLDPTGSRIAIAMGGRLVIRELRSTNVLAAHEWTAAIEDVTWHPDGERFAAALTDGMVILGDLRTGTVLKLEGHTVNTILVRFHPRGELLVSASWDGTTRFWDANSGRALFLTREGLALGFDRDGSHLAFMREGSGFGVWNVASPVGFYKLACPLKTSGRMITADFHPDGRHVVCGDEEEWYLGDTMTGRILHREPSPRLRSVLFSRGGDHIIRSGGAGLAAVRCEIAHANVSLSPIQLDPRVSSQRWLERAVFSPDGKYLLAVGADKGFVLDGNSLRPEFEFGQGYDLLAFAAISPDARWVVASTWKGVGVCVWNRETQTFLRSLIRESSHVDFDPSGRWLATSNHRGFQLWRTEDWTLHRTSEVDTGSYTPGPARFCPRGSLLAVAPGRNTIHLVEPESGKIALSLLSPDAINLTWLAFSRDGAQLAAATEQSDVHIWNLANIRTALQSLSLESEKVFSEMSTSTRTFNGPTAGTPSGRLAIGLIVGGMLLAVFFGVYSLVQQHRQMRNYVHIEELAEEQNHHLIAAELELQQSQKMKALGTLAAGVAHDFNNLLSVISLSNGFLKRGVRQDTSLAEETEAIDKAVKQGRQVVESMLGYSRGDQDSVPQSINLCELVEDSVGLLGQQFLSGIRLTMELDRRAPCVKARKGRLEQILLNLIVNAGEAMGAGGRLDIRVAARHRSELRTCVLAPAESPGYVELVVRDDGPGIAPDVLNRVFEPFFSTKTRGARQGTGLGLSMVYTLSSQEGYGVDVESTPGKGACFWIVIPTAPARQSLSSQSTNAD